MGLGGGGGKTPFTEYVQMHYAGQTFRGVGRKNLGGVKKILAAPRFF